MRGASRRVALGLALALAFVLVFVRGAAHAQNWKPQKHVELVSGGAAGSASDGVLRTIERLLQEKKLVDITTSVVNKPGGGGTVGWTYLSRQPPDGHHMTLLIGNLLSNYITGSSTLSHNDFTCAAQIFSEVTAVAVRADSPLRTATDLLAKLKADPASVSVAVGTAFGGSGHIGLALAVKGVGSDPKKMRAVVFQGVSQGFAALYGGHVELITNPQSSFAAPLKEGRVRVLAVAAPQRLTGDFAAVPTWKELGIDSTVEAFRAIAGPRNLGAAQTAYWEGVMRKMVDTPEWKQMLESRSWIDRYAGAEGCKAGFKAQYDQLHVGLQALGLAKR
jgi:putative tricarboxylic transport membrane protein